MEFVIVVIPDFRSCFLSLPSANDRNYLWCGTLKAAMVESVKAYHVETCTDYSPRGGLRNQRKLPLAGSNFLVRMRSSTFGRFMTASTSFKTSHTVFPRAVCMQEDIAAIRTEF